MIDRVRNAADLPVPLRRLWFGLSAAPLAWIVAGLGSYLYSTASCRSRHLALGVAAPMTSPVVGVLSALMLAIAVAGLVAALSSWRALGNSPSDPWWGRSRFMAGGGLFTSALFVLGIVLFAIPAFLVQPCSHIH